MALGRLDSLGLHRLLQRLPGEPLHRKFLFPTNHTHSNWESPQSSDTVMVGPPDFSCLWSPIFHIVAEV